MQSRPASIQTLLTGLIVGVCLLRGFSDVHSEDWPWFLGPRHTGVSGETNLKPDWTKGPPALKWKQELQYKYLYLLMKVKKLELKQVLVLIWNVLKNN